MTRPAPRVFIVGWDGADWSRITHLVDEGSMPYLGQLVEQGAVGTLRAMNPIFSSTLWTSLATGADGEHHGILTSLEPREGVGVRQVGSHSRRVPAFWNLLGASGLRTVVVGWPATHPAETIHGIVVSDRIADISGRDGAQWPLAPDVVAPASFRPLIRSLRVHPSQIAARQILSLAPYQRECDLATDEDARHLAIQLARSATVHAVGTYFAQHEPWDCMAVYYDLAGVLVEWFGRPAQDGAGPDDQRFEQAQSTIDHAYRFLDLMLGRYMRLLGPEVTMIVASCHSRRPAATAEKPLEKQSVSHVTWLVGHGFAVLSGPEIRRDVRFFGSSITDILPTIVELSGMSPRPELGGRVLADAICEDHRDRRGRPAILPVSGPSEAQVLRQKNPAFDQALRQLESQGYARPPLPVADELIEAVGRERSLRLAEVRMTRKDHASALMLLEGLENTSLQEPARRLRALCLIRMGRHEACRDLADEILAHNDESALGHLLRGYFHCLTGQFALAASHLNTARTLQPDLPMCRFYLGVANLHLKRWAEAQALFELATRADADDADSHHGLGLAHFHQQRGREAAAALRRSLALRHAQPVVHYNLGIVYASLGDTAAARRAFAMASRVAPELPTLQAAVADILGRLAPG